MSKRVDFYAQVALVMLTLLLFVPHIAHNLPRAEFDYYQHVQFAREMSEGSRGLLPHPLFHLSVLAIGTVLPLLQAGLVVAALFYVLLALVLYHVYFRHLNIPTRFILTIALLLVAPITVFTWAQSNLYFGYLLPHVYHNPTMVVLKPLALLLFLYAVAVFSDTHFRKPVTVLMAVLLTVLCTLSKPNFTISLLPALAAFALFWLILRRPLNWLLLLGIVLSGGLILVIQLFVLPESTAGGGGIVFDPFGLFREFDSIREYAILDTLFWRFLLSISFPLVVYLVYWRDARRDLSLNLSWASFGFGAFFTYFMAEPGRVIHGNFAWSGHITLLVLFVVSATFLTKQIRANRLQAAAWASLFMLGLHVINGVVWYVAELSSVAIEYW
jgi:hypothetical protein